MKPHTSYAVIVGALLAHKRRGLGFKQLVVSTAMGLSAPALSKIERGVTAATVENLARAEAVLEVSPGELVAQVDEIADLARAMGVVILVRRIKKTDPEYVYSMGTDALKAIIAAWEETNTRSS